MAHRTNILSLNDELLEEILFLTASDSIEALFSIMSTCKRLRNISTSKAVVGKINLFRYFPVKNWNSCHDKVSYQFHALVEDCCKRGHPDAIFIFTFTFYSNEVIIAKLMDFAKKGHNLSSYTLGILYISQCKCDEGIQMFRSMRKNGAKAIAIHMYASQLKQVRTFIPHKLTSSDFLNLSNFLCKQGLAMVCHEIGSIKLLKNGWPLSEEQEDAITCPYCQANFLYTYYYNN